MSPVKRPPIAQPIVTQKLPHYLTKEAIDNNNKDRREQRFDILGKEPLIRFLTDLNLLDYVEQAAVPQWIFFNEEIVQALCTLSVNSDALNTYRQELLHHCTYHRITLFLRQLLITIKSADTGFIICWLAHQPIHIRSSRPLPGVPHSNQSNQLCFQGAPRSDQSTRLFPTQRRLGLQIAFCVRTMSTSSQPSSTRCVRARQKNFFAFCGIGMPNFPPWRAQSLPWGAGSPILIQAKIHSCVEVGSSYIDHENTAGHGQGGGFSSRRSIYVLQIRCTKL